jgi:hypothetical protein
MQPILKIASLLLVLAAGSVSAADKGQVTSVLTRNAERVFAVRIISVDGENLPEGGRNLVRLAPGKRRLGLVALIERDNSFNLRRQQQPEPQEVDIDVESGKHYRVGAKVTDAGYRNWTPVIEFR